MGEHFSAFIVERTMPGVSLGPEEQKMGIKGSSTRQVILEDVKVPVENLLCEIGKGHQIAFNILNIGRFKLGAGASAGPRSRSRRRRSTRMSGSSLARNSRSSRSFSASSRG